MNTRPTPFGTNSDRRVAGRADAGSDRKIRSIFLQPRVQRPRLQALFANNPAGARKRWKHYLGCGLIFGVLLSSRLAADWSVEFHAQMPDLPGRAVTIQEHGRTVARFVHGEGQQIPYLALFDDNGRQLTNPGIDAAGNTVGSEPHHRGIFIGWQKVVSELGAANLWSIREGTSMQVTGFSEPVLTADSATIVATIEWRAGKKDANGSDLLVTETRRLRVSRPEAGRGIEVGATFLLRAARDLTLDGDVQHAGIHLRVSQVVAAQHVKETSYLWSPDVPAVPGKVISSQLRWGEFRFPLQGQWYSAMQMNAPTNPVEEYSTREYGRFGFFFKRELKRNEVLDLHYGFLVRPIAPPAGPPVRSGGESMRKTSSGALVSAGALPPTHAAADVARARAEADAAYARFLRNLPRPR